MGAFIALLPPQEREQQSRESSFTEPSALSAPEPRKPVAEPWILDDFLFGSLLGFCDLASAFPGFLAPA